jgi:demethylmenaquinone methyltransferase/2-methoxy-6-polyprenyl-1,4-benzoquinol methylase
LKIHRFNTKWHAKIHAILETDRHLIARKFFSSENASSYDSIVRYTTFLKDSAWKKEMVSFIGGNDKIILDLACGTGILSTYIQSGTSHSIIVGSDLTYDYLMLAKNRQNYLSVTNSLAEFLPYKDNSFDVIISSYLVKYANLSEMVKEHWRVLRKNGVVIIHDFTYPSSNLVRVLWHLYFQILNQLGKVITSWQEVFSNLDKFIQLNPWVNDLVRELDVVAFKSISKKYYTHGTAAIVRAIK